MDGRGSTTKFAGKVGENTSTVSNWFGRKNGIGNAVLTKILTAFPDVDRGWLIGGNGTTLKGDAAAISPTKNFETGVPYFDVDFECGFDIICNDNTTTPSYLIDFKPYNKATCWCNVTGPSMEPEINSGDIVALKEINDWSFIPLGEIYAIITKNKMRTIKRICVSSNEDTFTLVPTNTSMGYSPQDLKKDLILKLYKVIASMKKLKNKCHMKISESGIAITKRSFDAIEYLRSMKKIMGLQTFTREHDINYWNICTVRNFLFYVVEHFLTRWAEAFLYRD